MPSPKRSLAFAAIRRWLWAAVFLIPSLTSPLPAVAQPVPATAATALSRRLVFATQPQDGTRFAALAPDGGTPIELAIKAGPVSEGSYWNPPSLSPQGTRLAYATNGALMIADADGTGAKTLWSDPKAIVHPLGVPAWSPDGSDIAFIAYVSSTPRKWSLNVIRADGSNLRIVTEFVTECCHMSSPAWSPDGKQIAYIQEQTNPLGSAIMVVGSAGGAARTIFQMNTQSPDWIFPNTFGSLSWSPASSLLFDGSSGLGEGVYQIAADGTGAHIVLLGGRSPSWGPDGVHFAAVLSKNGSPSGPIVLADASGNLQATLGPPDVWSVRWGGGGGISSPGPGRPHPGVEIQGQALDGLLFRSLFSTVATFTDADPNAAHAQYVAKIDWGDGQTTLGIVDDAQVAADDPRIGHHLPATPPPTPTPGGGGLAHFAIEGEHSYKKVGTYPVVVTLTNTTWPKADSLTATTAADISPGIDADHDGIPDWLEQSLGEKYAPILFFHPQEPNLPVNVEWLLMKSDMALKCEADTMLYDLGTWVTTADGKKHLEPHLTQDSLSQDFTDESCAHKLSTLAPRPEDAGLGGSGADTQTYFYLSQQSLVDDNSQDAKGATNPSEWTTYLHAYPTSDGGIMLQYWHIFSFNDYQTKKDNATSGFDQHRGDWDAQVQVQLDASLEPEGVWFSRHTHALDFMPKAQVTWAGDGDTHPQVMVDAGGHAAYASPADFCKFHAAEYFGRLDLPNPGLVVWPDLPGSKRFEVDGVSPAPVLREIGCTNIPQGDTPNSASEEPIVGGTVWHTGSGGAVSQLSAPGASLRVRIDGGTEGMGGPLLNVGEYNSGSANCGGYGPRTCIGLPAGAAYPLNSQTFICYSGIWADPVYDGKLGNVGYSPRGPVFQGYDETNEVYQSWYNSASLTAYTEGDRLNPSRCGALLPV